MAHVHYEVEFGKEKNILKFVVKNRDTEKVRNFTIDLNTNQFYGVSKNKPLVRIPYEYQMFSNSYSDIKVTFEKPELKTLWSVVVKTSFSSESPQYINIAEKWINIGIPVEIDRRGQWIRIPFTKEVIKYFKENNLPLNNDNYEEYLTHGFADKIEKLAEIYPFDSGSQYSDIAVIQFYKNNIMLNERYSKQIKDWVYKQLVNGIGYLPSFREDIEIYIQLYHEVYGTDYSHLGNNLCADIITLNRHKLYAKYLNCDDKLTQNYSPLLIPELEENTEYTIITPKSVKEFQEESRQQGNCVLSNYCRRVADGETNIYFIRKKQSPDKSFITLEIQNGRIGSMLGKANSIVPDPLYRQLYEIILSHIHKR